MVKEYLKRRNIANHDVRYVFTPGSLVLLKAKQPGKRKVTAVGPYAFIKYMGPQGVVAKIANKQGKLYEVSAANLIPVHEGSTNRLMRFDPPMNVGGDDSDSLTDSSMSERPPPKEAVIEPTAE